MVDGREALHSDCLGRVIFPVFWNTNMQPQSAVCRAGTNLWWSVVEREARNRPGRRPRPCLRRPSRTSSVDGWPPVRHQLAVCVWFGTWAVFCENFGAEHYERRVGAEFVMRKKSRWVDSEEAAGVEHDGEEHLGRRLDHRDRQGEAGPGAQLWGVRWEWFGFCCFVFTFW